MITSLKSIFRTQTFLALSIILIGISSSVSAQNLYPAKPKAFVTDLTNTLSLREQNYLNTKLSAYRDSTSTEFAILVISSLQGNPIEEVSINALNDWSVGQKDKRNGLLILVAMSDRKMRIEVGYGLEGAIPDVIANRIIEDVMKPNFRNGNYFAGINSSVDQLFLVASGEYKSTKKSRAKKVYLRLKYFVRSTSNSTAAFS